MEWLCVKHWRWWLPFFYAITVFQINGSNGYFPEEKKALLDYKEFLKFHNYSAKLLFPSWVSDPTSDCCTWKNVTCDSTTGHVIHLSLDAEYQRQICANPFSSHELFSLNLSLFQPLKELRSLDLSWNCFDGLFLTKDYRSVSILKMLETLDLSRNFFDLTIMKALRALTSLKNLILHANVIEGNFPIGELSSLQNLETMDLSMNELSSPSTIEDVNALSRLKKLKALDLSRNNFDEKIFKYLYALPTLTFLFLQENNIRGALNIQELSVLQNLEKLDLSYNTLHSLSKDKDLNSMSGLKKFKTLNLGSNYLDGEINWQDLCNIKTLQELNISFNELNGTLHACLGNLTSLRTLDLQYNSLSGSMPSGLIVGLTSLEYLSLSGNNFEGTFFVSCLANHSRLKKLSIGEMKSDKFQVNTENPVNWNPSFQLKVLNLSDCQLNSPTRKKPSFLLYQHSLESIDLSGNKLVGMFPNWLLLNNPKLELFLLNDNSFDGSFQLPTHLNQHMDQLIMFDISNNEIQGWMPKNIGFFFPRITHLNVSNNKLDGEIPTSIGEMSDLFKLDLANNNFSGEVPKQIFLKCYSLSILILSHNSLLGKIFPTPSTMEHLSVLLMDNNQFNGTVEDGMLSMSINLQALDISNNKLSGRLPSNWPRGLRFFSVSRNNFEGGIPKELCKLNLKCINLSYNKFFGSIPSCFNMSWLTYIHLPGNSLTGTIPASFSGGYELFIIDVRDNNLSGSIPEGIYGLTNLKFLLLGGNAWDGELSKEICKLKGLQFLDLSRNKFIGSIPSCLNNISFANYDGSVHLSPTQLYGYNCPSRSSELYLGQQVVALISKSLVLSYKGNILFNICGLDLSLNHLTGEIPTQLGELSTLHTLNLSHNKLNGTIPKSFCKLENIESLDLSYNNLSGNIPVQLQDLNYLAIFNVSYNNLSGSIPNEKQFGTFDESCYKGNPYLHWENSNRGIATSPPLPIPFSDVEKDESAIEFAAFFWSFGASFVMIQLALVAVLRINPYWRRAWFYFIESCLYKCFGQFLPNAFYRNRFDHLAKNC